MATKSTTKSPARKAATTARKPVKTVHQKETPPRANESKTKAAEKPARPIALAKEKGAPARIAGSPPKTTEERHHDQGADHCQRGGDAARNEKFSADQGAGG